MIWTFNTHYYVSRTVRKRSVFSISEAVGMLVTQFSVQEILYDSGDKYLDYTIILGYTRKYISYY